MERQVRRWCATLAVLALGVAACGNSGDDEEPAAPTTEAPGTTGGDDTGTTTATGEGDRDTFVAIEDVPGVTDETISYSIIATEAGNPLGTCILDCYRDGIDAYF